MKPLTFSGGCIYYSILFVLLVCALTVVIFPFYWLYTLINGFVGITVVSVLIELVVIALVVWIMFYSLPRVSRKVKEARASRKSRNEATKNVPRYEDGSFMNRVENRWSQRKDQDNE